MPRQRLPIDRWWVSEPGIMATGVTSEDDARRVVEAIHRLSLPDMNKLIQAHKRFVASTTPMGQDSAMEEGLNS